MPEWANKRINGVTVYVEETLVGTVAWESGKALYTFNNLALYGRVVKVKAGTQHLILREVEVYGKPQYETIGELDNAHCHTLVLYFTNTLPKSLSHNVHVFHVMRFVNVIALTQI